MYFCLPFFKHLHLIRKQSYKAQVDMSIKLIYFMLLVIHQTDALYFKIFNTAADYK